MEEYNAKLLTTSVQKFRKELDMKSWEKIVVQYEIDDLELHEIVIKHKLEMEKALESQIFVNEKVLLVTDIIGKKKIEIKDHGAVELILWRNGSNSLTPETKSKAKSNLENNLLAAFQSFDPDKTGFVSTANFQKVVKQFNIHINREELNHLIQLKYEEWIKKQTDK